MVLVCGSNVTIHIMGAASYAEFKKCLEIYQKEIISRTELIGLFKQQLSEYQDLLREFENFLDYYNPVDGSGGADEIRARPVKRPRDERTLKRKNEKKARKEWKKVDKISREPIENPSYRFLPESFGKPRNTTAIGKSVLNSEWKSSGIWKSDQSSDDYSTHVPNKYEEILSHCEDDIFHFDLLFHMVRRTRKRVKRLLQKMLKKTTFSGHIRIEKHFTSSNIRCIECLYGDNGSDIIDLMRDHPKFALPVVFVRLSQKRKELSRCSRGLKKAWAKVVAENSQKSLQFQATN